MAPNPYDPDDPCGLGNEWRVTRETSQAIRAQNDVVLHSLDSSNTRDISFIWVYLTQAQALATAGGTGFEIEIYEESNLGSPNLVAQTFRPEGDVRNFMGNNPGTKALCWGPFAPSGTNVDIYRGINSASLTPAIWPNSVPIDPQPVDNDRFVYAVFGAGYDVAFHAADLATVFTTERITRVTTKALVGFYIWSQLINGMGIKPYLLTNGQMDFRAYPEVIHAGVLGGTLVEASWTYNPATRASWKIGEVDLFASSNENPYYAFGWQVAPTGSSNNLATILQAWMEIETTDDTNDARVAYAQMTTATSVGFAPPKVGWNRVPLFTPPAYPSPPAGFGWSKLADTSYVVSLRRTSGGGLVAVRKLVSDGQVPPHVWTPAFFQIPDPALVPVNYFRLDAPPFEEFEGQNWAVLLEDDTTALDPDSQPYASGMDDLVPELGINDVWTRVSVSHEIQQDFTPPSTDEYAFFKVVGALDGLDAAAPLVITIHRRSDDVQFGGQAIIQPSELVAPRDRYQNLEGQLDSAAPSLVGGTQYYMRFRSAAPDGAAWRVQVLSSYLVGTVNGPPATVGGVTFGGTTERAHVDGTPHDELDVAAAVYTVPSPPSTFTPVEIGVDPLSYVSVEWTPTDVASEGCGDFMRYEIERADDGTTFRRRWEITDEATDSVPDVEIRRNHEMTYRIRVRRADHSCSDWVVATITVDSTFCGYWFGSNEWGDLAPTMLRWADDIGDRTDTFAEPATIRRRFYARDYGVTFRSIEFDGAQFDRELFLAGHGATDGTIDTPTTPGQEVWLDFMRAILPQLGATTSYTAVASNDGDLWLGSVTMKDGGAHRTEPDGSYQLSVHISEDTNVPSIVAVTP